MSKQIKWTESNLQCALGMMLDRNLLHDEGLIIPNREKDYTKNDLIGYALYLHVRGGLFNEQQMTMKELDVLFNKQTKGKLRQLINTAMRKYVRVHTVVKGTKEKDAVEVSVSKKQPVRKVVQSKKTK
jgi:hypothetical protein